MEKRHTLVIASKDMPMRTWQHNAYTGKQKNRWLVLQTPYIRICMMVCGKNAIPFDKIAAFFSENQKQLKKYIMYWYEKASVCFLCKGCLEVVKNEFRNQIIAAFHCLFSHHLQGCIWNDGYLLFQKLATNMGRTAWFIEEMIALKPYYWWLKLIFLGCILKERQNEWEVLWLFSDEWEALPLLHSKLYASPLRNQWKCLTNCSLWYGGS